MGRPKPSIMRHMLRRLECESYSVPVATSVLGRYRTETLNINYPIPAIERAPEARLYKPFYEKYPQAKAEPIVLNSTRPSIATTFVRKQLAYMDSGMTAANAFATVELELHSKLSTLGKESISGGYLNYLQQQEQQQLEEAWSELNSKYKQQQQQQQHQP